MSQPPEYEVRQCFFIKHVSTYSCITTVIVVGACSHWGHWSGSHRVKAQRTHTQRCSASKGTPSGCHPQALLSLADPYPCTCVGRDAMLLQTHEMPKSNAIKSGHAHTKLVTATIEHNTQHKQVSQVLHSSTQHTTTTRRVWSLALSARGHVNWRRRDLSPSA